jgi:hypothetical protein
MGSVSMAEQARQFGSNQQIPPSCKGGRSPAPAILRIFWRHRQLQGYSPENPKGKTQRGRDPIDLPCDVGYSIVHAPNSSLRAGWVGVPRDEPRVRPMHVIQYC